MKSFLLAIFVAFSIFPTAYAEQAPAQTTTEQAEKTVVLYVDEMNCQLCVYLVNKELRAIDGVISTKASMKTQQVSVVAKSTLDNEVLIQAVKKLHYSAKVM